MMTAPLRVLVAENQYLIAMEVERILLDDLPCDVTIAPLARLAEAVQTTAFDGVIIDAVMHEARSRSFCRPTAISPTSQAS